MTETHERQSDLAQLLARSLTGEIERVGQAISRVAQLPYDVSDAHLAGVRLICRCERLDETDGLDLAQRPSEHRVRDGLQQALAHLWRADSGERVQARVPAGL
jgi:hypothetical protein